MTATDTILETRGLTKEFRGFVAVRNVSLSVRRGSIHALRTERGGQDDLFQPPHALPDSHEWPHHVQRT